MSGIIFSFGVSADVQYADKDPQEGYKFYREALEKLKNCIQEWNKKDLKFTVHLGDIIDGNSSEEKSKEDLDRIIQVFEENQKKKEHIHVIGNHCLKVPRDYLMQKLAIQKRYYDFVVDKFRIIVLDGTDISIFGWDKDSDNYKQAIEWLSKHDEKDLPNATDWNAAIGQEQKLWLKDRISESKRLEQKVIVMNHFPLLGEAAAPTHVLWNGDEIIDLLEPSVVIAFFSGHYHPGGYVCKNGVHHVGWKGILEAPNDSNCFGIVDVFEDRLEVRGFGTEPSRTLRFH